MCHFKEQSVGWKTYLNGIVGPTMAPKCFPPPPPPPPPAFIVLGLYCTHIFLARFGFLPLALWHWASLVFPQALWFVAPSKV